MSENAEKNICANCLGVAAFSQWIADNGEPGQCDYDKSHGAKNPVVTLHDLATHTDEYFRANYCQGGEYVYFAGESDRPNYETYGESYKHILSNDLDCFSELMDELCDYLASDIDDYWPPDGGEPFYDDCANYELLSEAKKREEDEWADHWYEDKFAYPWHEFCETVKYKRRFFKTAPLLDDLFGKADEYESGTVRPLYTIHQGETIYRARLLSDTFTEATLNTNPAMMLSAPPSDKTKAGRMNVEFIPVFYGAFGPDTALAELRPSIGDAVAIGKYKLKRPIKVFDFTAFDHLDELKHLSDEERLQAHQHTRYDFIKHTQEEISKPITQYQKQLEYIPTQIIAEYLSEHFGCDAVIYKSSLFRQGSTTTSNIALFSKDSDFIGAANSAVEYVSHEIRRIDDVTYATSSHDWI